MPKKGIANFLRPSLILANILGTDKDSVLREFSRAISLETNIKEDHIYDSLREREMLGSTAIGEGIAIPHGKVNGLTEPVIAVGVSQKGVPFDALDGKNVHLFVVILTPSSEDTVHLNLLARLARILRDAQFRQRVMMASDKDYILNLFDNADQLLL